MKTLNIALLTFTAACTAGLGMGQSVTKSVYPGHLEGWLLYNDNTDTVDNSLGTFEFGPSPAPLGKGSLRIPTIGTQRPNLATYQFSGTKLAEITVLRFQTYNPSDGNGDGIPSSRSAYMHFNVDFNLSDTWQRRLVYVPRNNGVVKQDLWQEWDAIDGGAAKWSLSGGNWPGTSTPGTTLQTWNWILSTYPDVRIRVTDSFLGLRVGEPYSTGYVEYLDAFQFGTAAGTTTFDLEPLLGPPANMDECKNGGWQSFNFPVFKNQGECVSLVSGGK